MSRHTEERSENNAETSETRSQDGRRAEESNRVVRQERSSSSVQALSTRRQGLQGPQVSRSHSLNLRATLKRAWSEPANPRTNPLGFALVILFLIAVLLLVNQKAFGAEPTTKEWARAALARCPTPNAGPEDLNLIATELARQVPSRRKAALLIAIGCQESHYDKRIIAGKCKQLQCDRGKARGAWQGQRNRDVAELWDKAEGDIPVQLEMALKTLNHSQIRCEPFAPFPAHVFRAYRGGSCSWELKDEAVRSWMYEKAVRQR